MSILLENAIRLAVEAHAGQVDKQGRTYILHPLAVMFMAEAAYKRNPIPGVTLEEFMAAAVLHDVCEDNPKYPLSFILAEFGVNVHRIVDGVTRRKAQGETYREFIIRANQDLGSRLLKILDIFHNLGRIDTLPIAEQDIRRRYEKALVVLNPAEFSLEEIYLGSPRLISPKRDREHSIQGSQQ